MSATNTNPAWMHWSRTMRNRLAQAPQARADERAPLPPVPTTTERLPVVPGPVPKIPISSEVASTSIAPTVPQAIPEPPQIRASPTGPIIPAPPEVRQALLEELQKPAPPEPTTDIPRVGEPEQPAITTPPVVLDPVPLPPTALPPPPPVPTTPVVQAVASADGGPSLVRTAALTLEAYLRAKGANFGSRAKPSEAVRTFQTVANVNPDGIMGPITRAAGEAVGVRFPFPGDATSGAVVIPAPVVDPAVLNSATAIGASTPQAAAAKMQSVAAVQTALGVTPTGQIDSATKQQAAALGVALPPTGTTTAHNPFGAHSCAADLPPKYGPVRDALVSFASARPEYLFSKHQSQCLAGLLSVLTSSARGGWSTAKPDAQGTGWLALGPLNLTTPTAEWLLQSKGVLKPFDTKLKVSGATGTRDRAASLRTSATTPASGAWWYILTLAKLEDMLRPALDLPSFAASGLLTPNPSAPPSAAPLAQQLSTAVNALVKANPTEDPISILMRLFLKASSLKGMVTAAQKADGKIP